jgi:hypothetical protein
MLRSGTLVAGSVRVEIRSQRGRSADTWEVLATWAPAAQLPNLHCNLYERKLVRSGRAARLRIAQEWRRKCFLRGAHSKCVYLINCLERKSWTETRCPQVVTYIELIFSRGLQRLWLRLQV